MLQDRLFKIVNFLLALNKIIKSIPNTNKAI